MLPQIDNQLKNTSQVITLPSKTYKLNLNDNDNDRIIGFVDKLDAVKQAVYHILSIERYAYLIYDNNYGVELEQYIGQGFEYLYATIEETLKEALTHDLRITNILITNINKISNDTALVEFEVQSIYGNLQMGVNIIV